jgi:hypothetical protein
MAKTPLTRLFIAIAAVVLALLILAFVIYRTLMPSGRTVPQDFIPQPGQPGAPPR